MTRGRPQPPEPGPPTPSPGKCRCRPLLASGAHRPCCSSGPRWRQAQGLRPPAQAPLHPLRQSSPGEPAWPEAPTPAALRAPSPPGRALQTAPAQAAGERPEAEGRSWPRPAEDVAALHPALGSVSARHCGHRAGLPAQPPPGSVRPAGSRLQGPAAPAEDAACPGASGGRLDRRLPTPGASVRGLRGPASPLRPHSQARGVPSTRPGTGWGEPTTAPDGAVPATGAAGPRGRWVPHSGFCPLPAAASDWRAEARRARRGCCAGQAWRGTQGSALSAGRPPVHPSAGPGRRWAQSAHSSQFGKRRNLRCFVKLSDF